MTKRDRLMNALKEIKSICSKNEDDELGCGKKCPFLMGQDGDDYRPCEVIKFLHAEDHFGAESPQEWGKNEDDV